MLDKPILLSRKGLVKENNGDSAAFVDVKLGKIRKPLVYVVGEVKNQGPYTVGSGVATFLR